jgi:hypothetical protein
VFKGQCGEYLGSITLSPDFETLEVYGEDLVNTVKSIMNAYSCDEDLSLCKEAKEYMEAEALENLCDKFASADTTKIKDAEKVEGKKWKKPWKQKRKK